MKRLSILLAAAVSATVGVAGQLHGQTAPAPLSAPAPAAPSNGLPPGPGHDTMVRVCSACHAPEIAAQQRLDSAGWHDLVDTMAGRGAQGTDADFAEITAYLAKNFPDQPARK